MKHNQLKRTSKFLSLILRHQPQKIGIQLDPHGWVEVDTLLAKLSEHSFLLKIEELEEVVATNNKKRFAFNEEKTHIRASQGHSVEITLGYEAVEPPDMLFHGTAIKFLDSIKESGLIKGKRHHVHMSADLDTASKVGMRHGKLVILMVKSLAMHKAGYEFFVSENGVWLTDAVPVEFLEFPAVG
ncbi:MAG: RNA 2'-phosphotransferase [Bacteroidota bacterium]